MTRTENNLSAAYTEPLDTEAVERRLISWAVNLTDEPGTHRPRVTTWAAAGAGAVAVAAITVTAAVIGPQLHSNPQTDSAGGQSGEIATPAMTGTAEAVSATVSITPQLAVQTFIDLLPRPGKVSQPAGRTTLGWVGGEFVYDDGQGKAELSVGIGYPYVYAGQTQRQTSGSLCTDPAVAQLQAPCDTLSDGSQYTIYQGSEYPADPHGATEWALRLLRPDGVEIDLTEWNAPIEKDSATTRSEPPLTTAELLAIAQDKAWQATVSAADAARAASLFVPDATTTGTAGSRSTGSIPTGSIPAGKTTVGKPAK